MSRSSPYCHLISCSALRSGASILEPTYRTTILMSYRLIESSLPVISFSFVSFRGSCLLAKANDPRIHTKHQDEHLPKCFSQRLAQDGPQGCPRDPAAFPVSPQPDSSIRDRALPADASSAIALSTDLVLASACTSPHPTKRSSQCQYKSTDRQHRPSRSSRKYSKRDFRFQPHRESHASAFPRTTLGSGSSRAFPAELSLPVIESSSAVKANRRDRSTDAPERVFRLPWKYRRDIRSNDRHR